MCWVQKDICLMKDNLSKAVAKDLILQEKMWYSRKWV